MPQIMDNLFRPALSFLKIKCNHIILPTGQHQKILQSCVAYFYTKKESWCNLKKKTCKHTVTDAAETMQGERSTQQPWYNHRPYSFRHAWF